MSIYIEREREQPFVSTYVCWFIYSYVCIYLSLCVYAYINMYVCISIYIESPRRSQAIESAQRDESQQLQAMVDNKEAGLWV